MILIGEPPIYKSKMGRVSVQVKSLNAIANKVFNSSSLKISSTDDCTCDEMMSSLKDKFSQSDNRKDKIQLLTLMPLSWNDHKISTEMGCTRKAVATAKVVRESRGILATPKIVVSTKKLPDTTAELVKKFFRSSLISRESSNTADYVIVRNEDGVKQYITKRFLLVSLSEAYSQFKQKYPSLKVIIL